MPFKFEKLEIWKLAIDLANEIHILTRNFPKEEMFSLTSQMRVQGGNNYISFVDELLHLKRKLKNIYKYYT